MQKFLKLCKTKYLPIFLTVTILIAFSGYVGYEFTPKAHATLMDAGFDFRSTLGFVTDPSYAQFVSGSVNYPTTNTINGTSVTYGWESNIGGSPSDRDRCSSGVDPRLAGLNFVDNGGTDTATFRIDLPASGSYVLQLAATDTGSNPQNPDIAIQDTNSTLATVNVATTGGGGCSTSDQVADITNTLVTAGAWASAPGTLTETFSTTILRLKLGPQSASNSNVITFFRVTQQASANTATFNGRETNLVGRDMDLVGRKYILGN